MSDLKDDRRGAYDPVNKAGLRQPPQVKDRMTSHQKEQWGADVRPEAVPSAEPALPEGLVKTRQGPLNRRTGRKAAE